MQDTSLYFGSFTEIVNPGIISSWITVLFISVLVVKTEKWHGKHSHDPTVGAQKFHSIATPRVGGVAIFIALLIASVFTSQASAQLLRPMLIASLPAFAAGLTEDLTKRISPRIRLLATFVSAIMAWVLTGYTLNHIDVGGMNTLLLNLPLSVAFTAFAVAGVAHAVNMIDGFNGLAGGSVMISFAALGIIAHQVGDLQLAQLCITLIIVLSGFMLLNFPFGKLFMGDGGAYLLGFLLGWVAMMLPMRNPEVSVWASLLICAYPVNEVLFTIGRRNLSSTHFATADCSHLHSLIQIKIVHPIFGHLSQHYRSSLVSPFCWSYVILLSATAILLYNRSELLIAAWVASFLLYAVIYKYLSSIRIPKK
jgi:UDP-N-acetylmuramyl pentapeptide phosphotransferase/UDP-N-acetylglucosamine-1-phosphate transferase